MALILFRLLGLVGARSFLEYNFCEVRSNAGKFNLIQFYSRFYAR